MGKSILKYTGPELAVKARKFGFSEDDVAYCCNMAPSEVEWICWGGDKPPLHMAVFFSLLSGTSPDSRAAVLRAVREAPAARRAALDAIEWRTVPGCTRYQVSDDGRVRRAARGPGAMPGLNLKPTLSASGHHKVTVYRDDGTQWRTTVHQLVALAFLGAPPEPGMHVLHNDGDGGNNVPSNLRWGTPMENAADLKKHRIEKVKSVEKAWTSAKQKTRAIKRANKIKMLKRLERLQAAE